MFDLLALMNARTGKDGKPFRIKLLGDSITHGVGGTGFEQDGENFVASYRRNTKGFCWANLFKNYMLEKYSCQVINNGMSGVAISSLINNFKTLVEDEDDFILCTIGTNNRHQYMKTGERLTEKEISDAFLQSVLTLNKLFVEKNKKVVFVANIRASEENEKDGQDYWRILHMCDINNIYKRAREIAKFSFISMYDAMDEYCKDNGLTIDELLADGLHPNDKGYQIMFELIKKELNV